MDLKECIRFANKNPIAWVTMTDGDQTAMALGVLNGCGSGIELLR